MMEKADHDIYRAVRHLPEMLMNHLDEPFSDEEIKTETVPKTKAKRKEN